MTREAVTAHESGQLLFPIYRNLVMLDPLYGCEWQLKAWQLPQLAVAQIAAPQPLRAGLAGRHRIPACPY